MTSTGQTTIVGVFTDSAAARKVVDELHRERFTDSQIHMSTEKGYTGEAASGSAGLSGRVPEGYHSGGFMGWLTSLFGDDRPDVDSDLYERAIQRGECVVAVDVDSEAKRNRAIEIMNDNGVIDIEKNAAEFESRAGTVRNTVRNDVPLDRRSETSIPRKGESSIPVVQEDLSVGKRVVAKGGVRVFSRVIEQPAEQDVQLEQEKVFVERKAVNRPLTDADRDALRERTIEVTETVEEPVVEKRARVVEEVKIGKETTRRTQKVKDTVRRTEVTTEPIDTSSAATASTRAVYTDEFRKDYQQRYASLGEPYETYAPAYEYGYRMAGDSRYRDKSWSDVESTLKTDYLRNNPNSTWDKMKGAVRYGWEKVTGKR